MAVEITVTPKREDKPRRYYTEEQRNRVLSSGENPPSPDEMGRLERVGRNAAVGPVRGIVDAANLVSLVPSLAKASYGTFFGDEEQKEQGFGANFADSLYGKDAIAELGEFIESESQNQLARLPAHLRNKVNEDRIRASVEGSKAAKEILLKNADTGYWATTRAAEGVNEFFGLGDPSAETSEDELVQTISGALVPIGGAARVVTGLAQQGVKAGLKRGVKRAIELSLPGSRKTLDSFTGNIVVQTAVSQATRYATDQPSILTGDMTLAEEMAHSGEMTTDSGEQEVVTPSGKTARLPQPKPDGQNGMGGWTKAGLATAAGSAFVVLGALNARGARGISQTIIDDRIADAHKPHPNMVDTPKTMLRPTLTQGQRRYSDYVNRAKPLKDVAEKAMVGMSEADVQRKMEILERLAHEATPINIFAATARTLRYGDLPGLGRRTVPLEQLEKFLSTMAPDERTNWMQGMQLKHKEGEYRKRLHSLQDQIDIEENKMRAGTGDLQKLSRLRANQQTAQTTSPFDTMSVADARTQMAQFDANMRNQAGERMYRQITKDIREAQVKNGHYTQAEMDKMVRSNPYYVPQSKDPIEGATWWRKGMSIIKQDLKGRSEPKLYETRAAVFNKGSEHERIKNPADPITSLKGAINDFHSYHRKNEAIDRFVNSVAGSSEWGQSMRQAHRPVTMSEFNEGKVPKRILENNRVVAFARKGRIHLIEVADKEVARALQFNPGGTLGWLDAARRMEQAHYTGAWAPWFAWKGAQYEIGPIRMLKKHNRQFGIIQSSIKRAFPNSKIVDRVNDYMADGSVKLQMLAHAYGDITNNAVEAMSRKIASDLTMQSGMFNVIAQLPGGRNALYNMSDMMLRSFNDSMYTLLHKEGVLGQTFSNEPTLALIRGYDSAEAITKGMAPISNSMKAYRSVLDSVRSSAKLAYFAQNYHRMKRAGNGKIKQSELDQLIYETKVASGDMTVSPGNDWASKAQSSFTYTKTTMNSLAALGEAAMKRPTDFGLRFLTTAVVPKIWTISKISAVPGLAAWYWNDLNNEQRSMNTPAIKPEFFTDWAKNGEKPVLSPDYFTLVPDAPETIAFTSPIIAAYQYLGGFGTHKSTKNALGRPTGLVDAQSFMNSGNEVMEMLGASLDSLISIPTPALANAIFGIEGEIQRVATGMLTGDDIVENVIPEERGDTEAAKRGWNMFSALFGSTTDMIKQSTGHVAPDDDFVTAAGKIFYHTARQAVEKVPQQFEQFGAGTLFGGQRRLIATTGTRERMVETFKKVDLLVAERSAERKGASTQRLADPRSMMMRDELITSLNRHGMDKLKDKRSKVNKLLGKLEGERYKMSPGNYATTQNQLQKDMQAINEDQEAILDTVSNRFRIKYNMSAEDALDMLLSQ